MCGQLGRGINHHPGIDDAKGKKKRKKHGKGSDSDDDYVSSRSRSLSSPSKAIRQHMRPSLSTDSFPRVSQGKKKKRKNNDEGDGEIFRLSDFRKGGGDYADEDSAAGSGSASPVSEWRLVGHRALFCPHSFITRAASCCRSAATARWISRTCDGVTVILNALGPARS